MKETKLGETGMKGRYKGGYERKKRGGNESNRVD